MGLYGNKLQSKKLFKSHYMQSGMCTCAPPYVCVKTHVCVCVCVLLVRIYEDLGPGPGFI